MILLALLAATASPADTVKAMFAAFNRHDAAAMAKLYAPDAKLLSSDFCSARTGQDVERTYRELFAAFPDMVDTIDTMIVERDRVAVRFTATSKATGMRVPIITMLRVRDGRIVEDDSRFDTGGRACSP